ncbi:TPA: hypothetical protein DEA19_04415 [Candidatus Uhrbacteria bacterium]|nr:hypothetical protein [Candidatus Uhrbacteria bacterium]
MEQNQLITMTKKEAERYDIIKELINKKCEHPNARRVQNAGSDNAECQMWRFYCEKRTPQHLLSK